jgi:hypothetical protein
MSPTQFTNVTPAPFLLARPPASFLGRSMQPTLPQVGGYSRQDLERMRFALMQSGADPGMLQRIDQVIAMRSGAVPDVQSQMLSRPPLRPSPAQVGQPAASYNPFGILSGTLAQPVR